MILGIILGLILGFIVTHFLQAVAETGKYYRYDNNTYKHIAGPFDLRCRHRLGYSALHADFERWFDVKLCQYCQGLFINLNDIRRVHYEER